VRPVFVAVEGLDGSGGTTQSRLLTEWLNHRGGDALLTKEPSDGPAGVFLQEVMAASTESVLGDNVLPFLFAGDRQDHLDRQILPALAKGRAVVTDRYYHSSLAYQGLSVGLPAVAQLNEGFKAPDLTFFLWLSPEISFERVQLRGEAVERFETLDHLRSVAESYETVLAYCRSRGENIVKIDASKTIEEIHKLIIGHVEALLESPA
jgi:dTMP kinase